MVTMHKNHQCSRKGQFSQNHVFYQFTEHAYIRSIRSQFYIIATQHVDHLSNTVQCQIEPYNPI